MPDAMPAAAETDSRIWVFGYGSLIWRPAFPYAEKRSGTIQGWARRFWQGSPDHRGVPDAPGRVVTLVQEPSAVCWGVAYALAPDSAEATLAALDHREAGGYSRAQLEVACDDGSTLPDVLTYVATEANPWYLGEAPIASIAQQVARSHGPSGANREYVERLAIALREHDAEDEHVFALETALTRIA